MQEPLLYLPLHTKSIKRSFTTLLDSGYPLPIALAEHGEPLLASVRLCTESIFCHSTSATCGSRTEILDTITTVCIVSLSQIIHLLLSSCAAHLATLPLLGRHSLLQFSVYCCSGGLGGDNGVNAQWTSGISRHFQRQ